jgi:hypothetical protein
MDPNASISAERKDFLDWIVHDMASWIGDSRRDGGAPVQVNLRDLREAVIVREIRTEISDCLRV